MWFRIAELLEMSVSNNNKRTSMPGSIYSLGFMAVSMNKKRLWKPHTHPALSSPFLSVCFCHFYLLPSSTHTHTYIRTLDTLTYQSASGPGDTGMCNVPDRRDETALSNHHFFFYSDLWSGAVETQFYSSVSPSNAPHHLKTKQRITMCFPCVCSFLSVVSSRQSLMNNIGG